MNDQPKNFNTLILNSFEQFASKPATRYMKGGKLIQLSYRDLRAKVMAIVKGLSTYDFEENDVAVVWSENRAEWMWIDLGVLLTGGINVGIPGDASAIEATHIINDVEAKILFIEGNQQLEVLAEIVDQIPSVEKIIMLDPLPSEDGDLIAFDWLFELQTHKIIGKIIEDAGKTKTESSILTISYTRGKEALAKGVVLSHGNILSAIKGCTEHLEKELNPKMDQNLSLLSLSNAFERFMGYYLMMALGRCMGFVENRTEILQSFKVIKPKMVCGDPALYEKMYEQLLEKGRARSSFRKNIFNWAVKVGEKASNHLIREEKIPSGLKMKYKLALKLGLNKLKQEFGNQTQFFISSGSPLNPNTLRFFYALGIPILEGYGSTEVVGQISQSTLQNFCVGATGKTLPEINIEIANDGEILLNGPTVFKGYWRQTKNSKGAFTKEGFFKTGDIGKFDEAGNLVILSRKN